MKVYSKILLSGIFVLFGMLSGCSSAQFENLPVTENILINQLGYLPETPKVILVKNYSGDFKVFNLDSKKLVLSGETIELGEWEFSGEKYSKIDLSGLNAKGNYKIVLNDSAKSMSIRIEDSLYLPLLKASLKSYYFNRSGFEIDAKYGGEWARKAGHPDTLVFIHESAKSIHRKTGESISSPGGWYDAGDYNKYIISSAITTYTLLLAYEQYPNTYDVLSLDIPESENNIPDILDETLYNIRWMLSMQDIDGGVYHKLTSLKFDDFIMPADAVADRFVVMKSTPATLDFAASMAACSKIISSIEMLKPLADSCLIAAKSAWNWAIENSAIFYKQPADISTGEYIDTCLSDEWMWASVEMFLATNSTKYIENKNILEMTYPFGTPSWDVVQTLGLISIVTHPESFNEALYKSALSKYLSLADQLYSSYLNSPAAVSMDYFKWGSNSDMANQAMIAFIANDLTSNDKYFEMGHANVDYLLGRNPTGYCFVTGFGLKSPVNIHHRPSVADSVKNVIPGFLVGGPNSILLSDCGDLVERSTYPALSYVDLDCSYSTNEIAINWNAPLVFVAGAIVDQEKR
jgi:endoglucanase